MSYLAIARKWRPQTFGDVIGQSHVTRTLKNAIEQGRVHHAFLFAGARGVGKTSCARIFAKALNCETGPTAEPCGTCSSCTEIVAGSSPDVIEIDGASNNSVDEIRSLRDSARYMPARSAKKIYIIDEVHMLTQQAFNALLKTLEEPPGHVVFILATTEPQKIPDTILSRCLRFDFKRFGQRAVVDSLSTIAKAEGIEISEASLMLIAREGEGSLRDSQSLLDQVISFSGREVGDQDVIEILGLIDRSLIYEVLEGVVRGQPDACLGVVERVFSFGYDLKQLARDVLEGMRNLSVVKVAGNAERFLDVSEDELLRLKQLARTADQGVLSRTFSLLVSEMQNIHRSQSPRYLLEMVLLRMCLVRPAFPVDKLLGRLAELENTLKKTPQVASKASERSILPWDGQNSPQSSTSNRPERIRPDVPVAVQKRDKWTEIKQATSARREAVVAQNAVYDDSLPTMEDIPPGTSPGEPGEGRSWIEFLRTMDRNHPRFQTLLHGVVLDESQGLLRMAFPAEYPVVLTAAERCVADDRLLADLAAFYGGPMRFMVVGRDAENRGDELSPYERMELERNRRRRELEGALKRHKVVKQAIGLFELEPQEISYSVVLGKEPEL